jgi:hypothetical protein
MQYRKSAITAVAALATALAIATPASAAWRGGGWHHGGGWRGAGIGLGFATGAIVGSALAAPYYRGYGYGYGPYAYDDGYDEVYAAAPAYGGGGDEAYCAQRFKSYDPSSGTYLGYDGARHPCP